MITRWWQPGDGLAWAQIERLAQRGDWIMVQRPGLRPFILHEDEWLQLPEYKPGANIDLRLRHAPGGY